jgi:hypothetical protein
VHSKNFRAEIIYGTLVRQLVMSSAKRRPAKRVMSGPMMPPPFQVSLFQAMAEPG